MTGPRQRQGRGNFQGQLVMNKIIVSHNQVIMGAIKVPLKAETGVFKAI